MTVLPTAHCRLFLPTVCCLLPAAYCLLPTVCCRLPAADCPLPTARVLSLAAQLNF